MYQQQEEVSFFQLEQSQLPYHHHRHQQHHHNHQNISFNMMQSSPSSYMGEENNNNNNNNNNNENSSNITGAYDLGELDQALFLYLEGHTDHDPQDHPSSTSSPEGGMRPPTLNIFPSRPMHIEPSYEASLGVGEGHSQQMRSCTKRALEQPPTAMELSKIIINNKHNKNQIEAPVEQSKSIKREAGTDRKGPISSSEYERPNTSNPKGMCFGGGGGGGDQRISYGVPNISLDATVFDMEYTRWLEEHHRLSCELRAAVQEHITENELKMYLDNCVAHYDLVMNLKSMVAKTDVFHLVSGMWKTPAERCFLWLGGFRPSELVKIILHQIEPLTEEQLMSIYGLQQTTHEAEEALSQGLQVLHQSLSDVIAADSLTGPPNMTNYMGQMALAMNKLSTMENFVRQADSLRHQTLHRLHQILTTRQAAQCFLAIAEYSHRLRALSSLWMTTPRQE